MDMFLIILEDYDVQYVTSEIEATEADEWAPVIKLSEGKVTWWSPENLEIHGRPIQQYIQE